MISGNPDEITKFRFVFFLWCLGRIFTNMITANPPKDKKGLPLSAQIDQRIDQALKKREELKQKLHLLLRIQSGNFI